MYKNYKLKEMSHIFNSLISNECCVVKQHQTILLHYTAVDKNIPLTQ